MVKKIIKEITGLGILFIGGWLIALNVRELLTPKVEPMWQIVVGIVLVGVYRMFFEKNG